MNRPNLTRFHQITLQLLESGAIASRFSKALKDTNIPALRNRTSYLIGAEAMPNSELVFRLPQEATNTVIGICQEPNKSTPAVIRDLLTFLTGTNPTPDISDDILCLFRVVIEPIIAEQDELGQVVEYVDYPVFFKTYYNINLLTDLHDSFVKLSQYGWFNLSGSHHYSFNSFNDEIANMIDLLNCRPLGDSYQLDEFYSDKSIALLSPKMLFELHKGVDADSKPYYTLSRDSINDKAGEFWNLFILQSDRAGIIPCAKLCRYLARFLECANDGYHKHAILELNKEIANIANLDCDLMVELLLNRYDFDELKKRALHNLAENDVFIPDIVSKNANIGMGVQRIETA